MLPATIRTKKIVDYIDRLSSRKEVLQNQKNDASDPFKWELEGRIRELELVISEIKNLIARKEG